MNIIIHLLAGVLLALILALIFKKFRSKEEFKRMTLWFSASNLIDIDHLLTNPIYGPSRCGINFHPLHSWFMFPFYVGGLFYKKTKYLCIGILLHLALDSIDCVLMKF
ncbi:MAG: DUF6122 family protein [Nanoarchaeota archaeon]